MAQGIKQEALYLLEECTNFSRGDILNQFGGKALGLSLALQLRLDVPRTWLFPIEYYEAFVKTHPAPENFKSDAVKWLNEHVFKDLQGLEGELFAVRSSSQYEDASEHSFAGIFLSKLNVKKEDLTQAIAEIWDSCFSLRAVSYSKSEVDFRMGVLIQPMIRAKYAGVAFSKHPSPQTVYENSHVVVEFAPHEGEKVVQGEITPFRLSGSIDSLLSSTDAAWISSLLFSLQTLKSYFGYEVDIEFIIDENEKFWLLQQRPISKSFSSHVLNLSAYQRKYKRSLACLDSELLIEGCSLFLSPYLELPYQLEKWMVMTTGNDKIQELWVHEILDQAITNKVAARIQEDLPYLDRLETRYQRFTLAILEFDYEHFFDKSIPLNQRFFSFCEFILPLEAHYYVPMFALEALNHLLLKKFKEIDPKNAEKDLFLMGTFGIETLMELFYDELRQIRMRYQKVPDTYLEISEEDKTILMHVKERFGFLKCRAPEEEGYSLHEVFELLKKVLPKEESHSDAFENLKKKYLKDESFLFLFEEFRKWMRIRNQEMELLMYAFFKARPLFEEISLTLACSLRKVWETSKETILYCLRTKDLTLFERFSNEDLVIFRSGGKTRVSNQIRVLRKEGAHGTSLKGKTVFGNGSLTGEVKIAFSPKELSILNPSKNSILVTGMTTPDFIPYLKDHFQAIITDEGGILCHAAIVAREMSIPCLVGTGIATESLKDGTFITIDFDRGEIKVN